MVNIFFTSDTHYSHRNICGPSISNWDSGYRDFNSLEEMNRRLVESINDKVGEDDILYHLGDWSFGGQKNIEIFRNRLRVRTIHLIYGNHDENILHKREHKQHFASCQKVWEGSLGGRYFYLHHYANRVWNHSHKKSIHLYGHSHGSLPDDINSLSMDVGWDTNLFNHEKYNVYHIDEIFHIMDNYKKYQSIDHHKEGVN